MKDAGIIILIIIFGALAGGGYFAGKATTLGKQIKEQKKEQIEKTERDHNSLPTKY